MTTAQKVMNAANNGLIAAERGGRDDAEPGDSEANSAITPAAERADQRRSTPTRSVNAYDVASQVTNLTTQLQTAYSLTAQIAQAEPRQFSLA